MNVLALVKKMISKRLPPLTEAEILASKLTYLSATKLKNIRDSLEKIQAQETPGAFVEFGLALGGSGIFISRLMAPTRQFFGFDLFGMIPPPGPNDGEKSHKRYEVISGGKSKGIAGGTYYGYESDLYSKVARSFSQYGVPVDGQRVSLVAGLFEDTLPDFPHQIAFAHIDCDWYEPVKLCLETTYRLMPSGGIIILDDYNFYDGCKLATNEFLEKNKDMELVDATHHAILRKN